MLNETFSVIFKHRVSGFLCFTKALEASILEEEGVGAARKN